MEQQQIGFLLNKLRVSMGFCFWLDGGHIRTAYWHSFFTGAEVSIKDTHLFPERAKLDPLQNSKLKIIKEIKIIKIIFLKKTLFQVQTVMVSSQYWS
jgi:hypothetical protein